MLKCTNYKKRVEQTINKNMGPPKLIYQSPIVHFLYVIVLKPFHYQIYILFVYNPSIIQITKQYVHEYYYH